MTPGQIPTIPTKTEQCVPFYQAHNAIRQVDELLRDFKDKHKDKPQVVILPYMLKESFEMYIDWMNRTQHANCKLENMLLRGMDMFFSVAITDIMIY